MTKPKAKAPAAKPAVRSAEPAAAAPAAKVAKTAMAASAAQDATKPVAQKAATPVAKAASKPINKPASTPASKSTPKSVAQPVPPTVLKTPPAVAPTPAAKAAAKPAASPAASTAAAATVATVATPAAAKPAVAAPKPAKSPSRSSTRGLPVVAPASPPSNRFTDRFAPARHVKAPDPIEVQKSSYKADPKLVNAWKSKPGRELTVPELLAMPDSEYLNEKQVEFFRALLRGQRDELLSNAGETTEHLREDTTIVPDPADRATIEEEHALELRTRDRERKLLKKISQSLIRLDSNEYGFCDETGEPIGLNRLLARPTATLSLEAQQRRELKQKMFGD